MSDPRRDHLHQQIQAAGRLDENLPDGSMLMGWMVIAEWMSPSGDRWLSRASGDARGDPCPSWQRKGYLHDALDEPTWGGVLTFDPDPDDGSEDE